MYKHMPKKFCKEWTKKRKFIKKMRLRKMSIAFFVFLFFQSVNLFLNCGSCQVIGRVILILNFIEIDSIFLSI